MKRILGRNGKITLPHEHRLTRQFRSSKIDRPQRHEKEDKDFYFAYKQKHGAGPHLDARAVVTTLDKQVLLIRRSEAPGEGLLALPGGFLIQDTERFQMAAERHLGDQTGLALDLGPFGIESATFSMILKNERMFDHPERSRYGRVVTMAFHLEMPQNSPSLVITGDAEWISLAMVPQFQIYFFEDHGRITTQMIAQS